MKILKTFVKNYGYGSFIGVLSHSDDSEYRKTYLKYYEILEVGKLTELTQCGKETLDLEKLARKFINSQNEFILWSY